MPNKNYFIYVLMYNNKLMQKLLELVTRLQTGVILLQIFLILSNGDK